MPESHQLWAAVSPAVTEKFQISSQLILHAGMPSFSVASEISADWKILHVLSHSQFWENSVSVSENLL